MGFALEVRGQAIEDLAPAPGAVRLGFLTEEGRLIGEEQAGAGALGTDLDGAQRRRDARIMVVHRAGREDSRLGNDVEERPLTEIRRVWARPAAGSLTT